MQDRTRQRSVIVAACNVGRQRMRWSAASVCAGLLLAGNHAGAQTFVVSTAAGNGVGSLAAAIAQADAYGNGATINFQNNLGTITPGPLPDIDVGLTINGGTGNTISGQLSSRIFFVNAPQQVVVIDSLALTNGLARGGAGGAGAGGGGGGAGMGGALFVNAGTVNLQSVSFTNNSAVGGAGAGGSAAGGGGGGGLDFSGGSGTSQVTINGMLTFEGSGGGGGAHSSPGASGTGYTAGKGGGVNGAAANTSAVGPDGGGGGGTLDSTGFNNQGYQSPNGGNGSDFGGGGGGSGSVENDAGDGGSGGFGAGGGGGADAGAGGFAGNGGDGGFGGGGGGGGGTFNEIYYGPSQPGLGGFDAGIGGVGNEGGGGGGAGLGGAIFVRSGNGASVSLSDTSTDAGSVIGGAGGGSGIGDVGTSGTGAGGALFLMGGNTAFAVDAGKTETIAGTIAQSTVSSISMSGAGTLILSADNSAGYSGGTNISGGELSVSADNNLGNPTGKIILNGGLLQITGNTFQSTSRQILLGTQGGGFDIASSTNVFTVSQILTGSGGLDKTGSGALVLTGASSYTGPTIVSGGTLELGVPFNGTSGTLSPSTSINVISGATLMLGSALGQANVLGSGSNAPSVSIPPINLSNSTLTTFTDTTHNVGAIYLQASSIVGSAITPSVFYDFTFNSQITVDGSHQSSYITAPGGVGLRLPVPFDVTPGPGFLVVTGSLHDEPNQSGGVTKIGSGEMQLQGSDTYTAGTIVNAGTLLFGSAGAFPIDSALTINGGTAQFDNLATGTKFLGQLSALTIGGTSDAWTGKLDVTNNDLIIQNDSLATVTNQVLQGYAGGSWNGSAGILSSTAATDPRHLTALGVIQNNQSGSVLFSSSHLFDGAAPGSGDILLKYTYYGDATLDGKVDGSDYSRIDAAYLANKGTPGLYTGWLNGDFNYDGVIDGSDYTLIDNAFNSQGSQIASQIASPTALIARTATAVPEPASVTLLGIGAAAVLRRRKNR